MLVTKSNDNSVLFLGSLAHVVTWLSELTMDTAFLKDIFGVLR